MTTDVVALLSLGGLLLGGGFLADDGWPAVLLGFILALVGGAIWLNGVLT